MSVRSHLFVCSVAAAIDPVFKSRRSLPRNTILATGIGHGVGSWNVCLEPPPSARLLCSLPRCAMSSHLVCLPEKEIKHVLVRLNSNVMEARSGHSEDESLFGGKEGRAEGVLFWR